MVLDSSSRVVYLGYCLVFVCGLLLSLVWFEINCDLTRVLVLLRLIVFVVRLYLVVVFRLLLVDCS